MLNSLSTSLIYLVKYSFKITLFIQITQISKYKFYWKENLIQSVARSKAVTLPRGPIDKSIILSIYYNTHFFWTV